MAARRLEECVVLDLSCISITDHVLQMFCKEVVGWKSLCHPNVLPLLGATMGGTDFVIVSKWMTNGTITRFVNAHKDANRLELVCF